MSIKYYLQKFFARFLGQPITALNGGKVMGVSLVRSEFAQSEVGTHTCVYPPYQLRHVQLGDYSYIAKNSDVSQCVIGKFCSIGPNFCCGLGLHPTHFVSTHPMFYSTARQNGMTLAKENTFQETRQTHIGHDVFIGANVTVLDGVTIGDGAVIGAGAVVTKDIPPYAVAVGVPAKVVKYRFSQEKVTALMQLKWWDWSLEQLRTIPEIKGDIDRLVEASS